MFSLIVAQNVNERKLLLLNLQENSNTFCLPADSSSPNIFVNFWAIYHKTTAFNNMLKRRVFAVLCQSINYLFWSSSTI